MNDKYVMLEIETGWQTISKCHILKLYPVVYQMMLMGHKKEFIDSLFYRS